MVIRPALTGRSRRGRHRTLAGQFLLLQLVVLGLVLIAVALITVQQSSSDFRAERTTRMMAVAESLATTGVARGELSNATANPRALEAEIARATSLSGAQTIFMLDARGTIVASSLQGRSTQQNPAPARVSAGRSWSGDLQVDGRRSVGGQAPVLADGAPRTGRTVGAVLVTERYPSWWDRLVNAAPDLLLFMGIAALLGVVGSWAVSRQVRRQTRGMEPTEIAALADHREALLHGIHEGVVGVSPSGVVTVANQSAGRLLKLDEEIAGRRVADLGLAPALTEFLTAPQNSPSTVLVVDGQSLVLTRRRADDDGRPVGTVTTLVDRSDLLALQSRLAAQSSMTETLRAQTHEFDNRLHTLSGLLQLGEVEEATAYIGDLSRQRSNLSDTVRSRVHDPRVAALLIAKTSAANESGIDLLLEPESSVDRLEPSLSAAVLTVLGNLIDNAMDATRGHGRQISVRISQRADRVVVRVADSGPGLPSDDASRLFDRGWSTKSGDPAGRGVGLALVQAACERTGGSVKAMNGEHGAVFTATLRRAPHPDAEGS